MILVGLLTLIFGLTANAPIARADDGISAEGEAGIVSSSGNASSQTYNVKQATQYVFTGNTLSWADTF